METLTKRVAAVIVVMVMGYTGAIADLNVTVSSDIENSKAPISCNAPNALKPIVVAGNDSKCPGGVYCNYSNCGEFCCEWGYFYSNPCTCQCYRSSYDAGADCSSYFRCN